MAKGIDNGQTPPDDPMFSSGPQMFSPQRFKSSSTPTPSATAGATQDQSPSLPPASPETSDPMQPGIDAMEAWLQDRAARAEVPETEADGIRAEALRKAKVRRMASTPRVVAASSASSVVVDPLQPCLDSNLRIFGGGDKSGSST